VRIYLHLKDVHQTIVDDEGVEVCGTREARIQALLAIEELQEEDARDWSGWISHGHRRSWTGPVHARPRLSDPSGLGFSRARCRSFKVLSFKSILRTCCRITCSPSSSAMVVPTSDGEHIIPTELHKWP